MRTKVARILVTLGLTVLTGPGITRAGATPEAPEGGAGRLIMERVEARPRGGDMRANAVWRLIDRRGAERVRRTRILSRQVPTGQGPIERKWLLVVDEPASIRNTAFLVWSPVDTSLPNDQWLYLPAYRKLRRIAQGDRGAPFLGSDFAFEDLGDRGVDRDAHRWLRSDSLADVVHELVESRPLESDSPYARRLQWVDPRRHTVSRTDLYDRAGEPTKRLVVEWQQVDGIWAWKRLEMTSLGSGQRTLIEIEKIEYGVDLDDSLFSKSALRLGVR